MVGRYVVSGGGMVSKDTLYNGAGVGQVPAVPAVFCWLGRLLGAHQCLNWADTSC